MIFWTPYVVLFLSEGTNFAGISQVTAHTKIFCHTRGDAGPPTTTTTTATTTTMRGATTRNTTAEWGLGGWHQVPQEHLILISFAPTLWPTTWRSGISDRIRSQSVLRLSGRNTQKAVNADEETERGRVRVRQTESMRARGKRGEAMSLAGLTAWGRHFYELIKLLDLMKNSFRARWKSCCISNLH